MEIFGKYAFLKYRLELGGTVGAAILLIDRETKQAARGVGVELEEGRVTSFADIHSLKMLAFARAKRALEQKRTPSPQDMAGILSISEVADDEFSISRCVELSQKYALPLFNMKISDGGTIAVLPVSLFSPALTPHEQKMLETK